MTPSQLLAIEQLQRIAAVSDAVEIVSIVPQEKDGGTLRVAISLDCRDMPRISSGLPLRARERFTILIGAGYPYSYPTVEVRHARFAGYPHVNWVHHLCMYQAPQTEWSPAAGMAGFLERLELWLRKAALDELDPVGGALHPPVVVFDGGPLLIPRKDAPVQDGQLWFGLAELIVVSDRRLDLVGWTTSGSAPHAGLVAAAILLDRPMPMEYPLHLGALLRCLTERGVPLDKFLSALCEALQHNGTDKPLYVVLGTPMRGTRGHDLRQHLAAWGVNAYAADVAAMQARLAKLEASTRALGARQLTDDVIALRDDVYASFMSWADKSLLSWCRVREDRPEVTVRRDIGRPAAAFAGKAVEIWGCGALGSYMAEWIVRAGATRVVVRDQSLIAPGVLVRQPYLDADIGYAKAEVLAQRLRQIRPDCTVSAINGDILAEPLGRGVIGDAVELVIDATASNLVLTRIEEIWRNSPAARCAIASIVVDRSAEHVLAVVLRPDHTGGPLDVVRQMKLAACNDAQLRAYLDAFFPATPAPAFQPEPGCSDATFVGSAVDAALLAAAATNYVGEVLQRQTASAAGCFLTAPSTQSDIAARVDLEFPKDLVFADPQTLYETRMQPSVWRSLQAWKEEARRTRGASVETGGLLFGEMNEHLHVIWVSEASGPPPDSQHSAEEFVCGIEGAESLNAEKAKRTRNTVQYIGTWHTHPVSAPIPSGRDLNAMAVLLTKSPTPVERLLLFILGKGPQGHQVTANTFLRQEFEALLRQGSILRACEIHSISPEDGSPKPRLGIALSGGGSRAMAFHLGCLRALHDRGLLHQVEVLSTVSGGSVIGAMYAYSNDSFDEFEDRVRTALRHGFVWSIARRTLLSPRLVQIVATKAVSGVAAAASFAARLMIGQVESLLPRQSKATGLFAQNIQPPLRRWVSRTHAFEQSLRDLLFKTTKVGSPRRGNIDVVINACELRTGTAFRFGSRESGSWRYGTIAGNDVDVATAVAASAAYPAALPAIDRYFDFARNNGAPVRHRVILTDGGVYENLGVTCMTPERDRAFSTNVFNPPYIICCDAGPGQFDDVVLPYGWATRMRRAFETTHRQVQHGLQKQLHFWRRHGAIKGFVYSYLGQQDDRLPVLPPDLVRRKEVVHYPTDFSPMSVADIDLLSRRGEQLTRVHLDYYLSHL